LHIDDNLRAGMAPDDARRQALLALGGMESTKEACRDRGSIPYLENLFQDLRFALRQLQKNAAFTCTAILTLGLGMCASVAIFAFVDATLIKPLPYQDPNRLVGVYEHTRKCQNCNLSYLDYLDWKKFNHVFRSLEAYRPDTFMLSAGSEALAARGARVSDGFFRALGVNPVVGRDFYAGEDLPGASHAVILSYSCWLNRFGGRKDVQGSAATLDGVVYTIIGVLPRDFHFAPVASAEFWTPLHYGSCEKRRSCHNLYGVARLKDGISVETAQGEASLIAQQLEKQYPDSNLGQGANVVRLSEVIIGKNRRLLLTLLSGAGLLLLIACVNVASLLLVRSESRKRELAIRGALGASRSRLAQQFVTEGLVLVAAGSAIGLLTSYWTIHLLTRLIPTDMLARMPYLQGLGLNGRVLAFAGGIALAAAALFSITPTFCVSFPGLREGLAEGSRGSAGVTWRRLGSKLVVFELAAAMVLLVGAGLLGRSFYRLLNVDLGILPDHLATLQVAAPAVGYAKDEQAIALARQVTQRIASIPGVKSVGTCSQLPVSYNGNTDWIRFVGKPYNGQHNDVNERSVSAGYFATVEAKLLRGRYFREDEDKSAPRVIIINNALARMYFPGEDPIGKLVGDTELTPASIRKIVGLVDDIREGPLDEPMLPTEYFPFNQGPDNYFALVVRTSQDEASVLPAMAAAIHQIDPAIVTANAASMNDVIHDAPSTYLRRSSAWLVAGFAVMALLLGVVGLYGVVAYSVSQRTREIVVRMALGAERRAVYGLILKEAGWLVALGIGFGLACSIGAATLIGKLLFDTPAWDAPTLTSVALLLGLAALLASYLPARRAASVNPVNALRAE
jgi:macrolide transport system ATP-binding/permease protein